MIVLVADERDILLQYVAIPTSGVFDFSNQSSRPTTVIYEGAIGLANNLTGDDCYHCHSHLLRYLLSSID